MGQHTCFPVIRVYDLRNLDMPVLSGLCKRPLVNLQRSTIPSALEFSGFRVISVQNMAPILILILVESLSPANIPLRFYTGANLKKTINELNTEVQVNIQVEWAFLPFQH